MTVRSSGYAMSRLPDKYFVGGHSMNNLNTEISAGLLAYIQSKYSKYGYRLSRSIEYNPQSKENGYRWVENVTDGLREAGDADKIIDLRHHGWYIDGFQDETVKGMVYQLPARDGKTLFVPAVNDPCNKDCALVDFRSSTDDKEDCARYADRMAERFAESCRDDWMQDQVEQRLEAIKEEISELYQGFRKISRELRANCKQVEGIAVVRELVKEKWTRTKRQIHVLRAERTRIEREGYIEI